MLCYYEFMAEVKVLVEGYVARNMEEARATTTLVRDNGTVLVIDPGNFDDPNILVEALAGEGLRPENVTLVGITHSHIDHYRNIGLFPRAKVLEYFGLWKGERMDEWQESFSDHIQILKTPGHDPTSITFFVKTADGTVAVCGDVFWRENYPEVDPFATDIRALEKSRKIILKLSHWIVPGHGPMYKTRTGVLMEKVKSGQDIKEPELGNCRYCHRPFLKPADRCACQPWLCFRCCECEDDCLVCNCHEKIIRP